MRRYGIKGTGLSVEQQRRRTSSVRSSTLACEMLEERRVLAAYLQLGDLGNITETNHRGWMRITTVTSAITGPTDSSGLSLHDIEITRPWDSASPGLLEACAKGAVFQEAVIEIGSGDRWSSSQQELPIAIYTLQDAVVKKVSVSSGNPMSGASISIYGSHSPIQTVVLGYSNASWTYSGSFTYFQSYPYSYYYPTETITTTSYNQGPTDITLSSVTTPENRPVGSTVGTLATTDSDAGGSFTYTLVAGTGSTDNSSFSIVNGELRTAATFDFETRNSYSIRVRSTDQDNLFVEKAFTISVTDTLDLPGVPTSIVATIEGGQANVTWVAPSSDGGTAVMGYVVNYRSDTDLAWRRVPGVSSTNTTTIPAFPTGASYIFRVAAVNAVGRGSFSGHSNSIALPSPERVVAAAFRQVDVLGVAAFATAPATGPTTAPWAVGPVTVTARNGRAALRWRLPLSDGNSPITGYMIEYQKVGGDRQWIRFASTETTARTAVVTGLQNGVAYRFRVAARNAVGVGRFSPDSASVTPAVPVAVS